jgi:hypothetical protein
MPGLIPHIVLGLYTSVLIRFCMAKRAKPWGWVTFEWRKISECDTSTNKYTEYTSMIFFTIPLTLLEIVQDPSGCLKLKMILSLMCNIFFLYMHTCGKFNL